VGGDRIVNAVAALQYDTDVDHGSFRQPLAQTNTSEGQRGGDARASPQAAQSEKRRGEQPASPAAGLELGDAVSCETFPAETIPQPPKRGLDGYQG
jgi:hypothetical protein